MAPLSIRMHGEPDGRPGGVRPLHTVTNMRRDFKVVARRQDPRRVFALDQETGRTSQQDDPFRPVLIVPEAGRASLPGRDDPLDAGAREACDDREFFFVQTRRDVGKKASALERGLLHAWLCAPACSMRIAVSTFSSPPLWAERVIAQS